MKKVLYAEDEISHRKLIEWKLTKLGVDCTTTADGQEAMDLIESSHFDLIILDEHMPGMNGSDIARKVRSTDPDIPLISITSDKDKYEELEEIGFNKIFIKPLTGQNYLDVIYDYLGLNTGSARI